MCLKVNRLLKIFLLMLLLILFRVWHLTSFQREELIVESYKPQRRVLIEKAQRGIICDRFGVPLAVNRPLLQATVYYAQIARVFPRREYISKLSHKLAEELDLDAERVEDLIYSRASLFPHLPFVIKENITPAQYFRLGLLEPLYPGLRSQINYQRFYTKKRTASHLLGYLGAIASEEYLSISHEMQELQQSIECEDEPRLAEMGFASTDEAGAR
jgi:cell division protein FtsI/penicillin-binding protein 2